MNLFQVTKKQEGGGLALQTFTGNPVTFTTSYSEELPAPFNGINLKAAILATGGYDADTQTAHPIVGHSELNLVRCGKNLLNKNAPDITQGYIDNSGIWRSNASWRTSPLIRIDGNSPYVLSGLTSHPNTNLDNFRTYDSNKNYIGYVGVQADSGYPKTFGAAVAYIQFCWKIDNNDTAQLEKGSTATAYKPYHGEEKTINFGQTVYGGEHDAKAGKLRITENIFDMGDLPWVADANRTGVFYTYPITGVIAEYCAVKCSHLLVDNTVNPNTISDMCMGSKSGYGDYRVFIKDTDFAGYTADQVTTAVTGWKVVLKLATPIEIDVSALSVEAVSGVNNIVSDGGGDITVECLI